MLKQLLYDIQQDGKLMWFQHIGSQDGSFKWEGPKEVGTGWGETPHVFSAGHGIIYAITGGDLMWFRHVGRKDGSSNWEGPKKVGAGWGDLKHVFAGENGIIYGVTHVVQPDVQPDGTTPRPSGGDLMWFRHLGQEDGSFRWAGPNRVGTGWGDLEHVFAGANGIIYGVKPVVQPGVPPDRPAPRPSGGELLWFDHIGREDGSFRWNGPKKVGTGWGGLKQAFAGDDGLSLAEATLAIQQKYIQIGGRQSPLGRPIDANPVVQSNGPEFVKDFRGGPIKVLSDGGASAFITHRTVVRFRGIHCFGKSEAVDEPYAIVAVYAPDAKDSTVTTKFPADRDSYTDFVASTDASESTNVSPSFPGWAPQSVAISCTVMEHDSGDPDRAAAAVEDAIKKAAATAGAAEDIRVFTGILDDLRIPGLIADLLGVGDDVIGSQVLQIDIGEMWPKKPMQQFQNIHYNFESPLLSDGDASYKLYFEVYVEEHLPINIM